MKGSLKAPRRRHFQKSLHDTYDQRLSTVWINVAPREEQLILE